MQAQPQDYAAAIYELALENWTRQLGSIQKAMRLDADLSAAVQDPSRPAHERLALCERELTLASHHIELLEQELINEQTVRDAAQDLALEAILERANAYLPTIAPGYRLRRNHDGGMELEWIDLDGTEESRTGVRLQGGERFLISLALALGLSSLSAGDVRLASLFIEEGHTGPEPDDPELVLAALQALQAGGRHVTLISRAATLTDHAGAGVRVVAQGQAGESTLLVA